MITLDEKYLDSIDAEMHSDGSKTVRIKASGSMIRGKFDSLQVGQEAVFVRWYEYEKRNIEVVKGLITRLLKSYPRGTSFDFEMSLDGAHPSLSIHAER